MEYKSTFELPESRLAPARKSAQIISKQYPLDLSVPSIKACCLNRLLNHRNLALVELEVDDFSRLAMGVIYLPHVANPASMDCMDCRRVRSQDGEPTCSRFYTNPRDQQSKPPPYFHSGWDSHKLIPYPTEQSSPFCVVAHCNNGKKGDFQDCGGCDAHVKRIKHNAGRDGYKHRTHPSSKLCRDQQTP